MCSAIRSFRWLSERPCLVRTAHVGSPPDTRHRTVSGGDIKGAYIAIATHPKVHCRTAFLAYQGLTRAFTHSRTRALAHSRTRALAHSRTRALAHSRTHALTHSRTHALTHSRTHALTHSRTHALTHSRTHAHTHSLTHSLTHSHSCTHAFMFFTNHCIIFGMLPRCSDRDRNKNQRVNAAKFGYNQYRKVPAASKPNTKISNVALLCNK